MARYRRLPLLLVVLLLAAGAVAWGATATFGSSTATKAGGTLTVASVVDIDTLDPHKTTFAWDQVVWPLAFDALTRYTSASGSSVAPDLATSWTSSPNLKVYTFKLRTGVKFSNGKPVDAAAVVASLKRAFDPKTAFYLQTNFKIVKSVVAVNPTTVRITLSKASVTLPDKLASVQVLDTSPDLINNAKSAPIGSGPFTVKDFVPADHVTLVANPTYWGPKPSLAEIHILKAADPSSAITSLTKGDLQALGNVGLDNIKAIQNGGQAKAIISPNTAGAMMFVMDNTSPPFNNVYARQALSYATQRAPMLAAALSGVGTVASKNLPVPKAWLNPALPNIPFDLDKAKALFAKGGVGPGTKITFWTVSTQPFYSGEAQILQADLAKIGITLDIQTADVAQWAAKIYPPPKKFPNLISSEWYSGFPVPLNLGLWVPPTCECQWNNPKYNALIVQADATRNPAARRALIYRAEKIMQQDSPTIIVSLTGIPIAVRNNVKGAWVDPRDIGHFESAALTG